MRRKRKRRENWLWEPSSETSKAGGDSVEEIASDEEVVQPKKKKVWNN